MWSTRSKAFELSIMVTYSGLSRSLDSAICSVTIREQYDGEHFSVTPYCEGS